MALATGDLSANVNVGGDVSGLRRALDDGRSRLSNFANEARGALGRIDDAMSEIGSSLSSLRSASDQLSTALSFIGLAGAATGIFAAYRQVAASAKEWAQAGEQARRRGISVEFMSELRFAAEELGTETRVVNGAMDKFRTKVVEIRTEGTKSAISLRELNKPLFEAIKGAPDQKSALFAVADAIRDTDGAADQAKLAVELFGSEGISMIHVLSQGREGLATWAQAARDAGAVLSSETAAGANRLTHALDLLDRSPLWKSIEEKMIGFARNAAVIVGGSSEAMTDAELTRAIDVTSTQLGRLEEALKSGAKAGQEEIGVVDELKGGVRDLINSFGKDMLGKDQILPYDPAAAVKAKIEETKQRLAELKSLQTSRSGWSTRQEAIDLYGADPGATPGEPAPPDYSASASFLADLNKRTLAATEQLYALLDIERQKDLDKLEGYLADGTVRQEDAAKARFQIEEKYNAEVAKIREKSIQPIVGAISNDLDRAFSDWIENGKVSWDALANQIIADIARIAVRQAVLQPLFGGGPAGGTGAIGAVLGSIFHDGGLVGGPAAQRLVGSDVFASAPRMHGGGLAGLRSGEVPAILQKGEIVLPKNFGENSGGQRSAPQITFNVQTPDVEGFRRSESQLSAMVARVAARGSRNS